VNKYLNNQINSNISIVAEGGYGSNGGSGGIIYFAGGFNLTE
jgi:hypothetical protein